MVAVILTARGGRGTNVALIKCSAVTEEVAVGSDDDMVVAVLLTQTAHPVQSGV
jgi:hypothetical protein